MIIRYTKKFEREYLKLPVDIQKKAEAREEIFRKNPHAPTLKTHKLSGRLSDFWSFSVNYRYRIIFEFSKNDTIFLHSIGDHDIYR